jgi:hypothetical protein
VRWLRHPLREWTRTIVGEEPRSGPELDRLYERLGDQYPFVSLDRPTESADAVASAVVGTAEGAASAVKGFVEAQRERVPRRGSSIGRAAVYGTRKAESLGKESGQLLALAGIGKPPDPEATRSLIEEVTVLAKANEARVRLESAHAIPFPKIGDFAAMAAPLIGLNRGADRIEEIRIAAWGGKRRDVEIHAFDAAGYHVLELGVHMKSPGVLYIDELQASHGRSCDRLFMAFGGASTPGRGNAGLIAAGLESLIVEGAKAGLYAITTKPGSPQVQRLYEKMGFTSPGDSGPWKRRLTLWAAEKVPVASGLLGLAALSRQALAAKNGEDGETMLLDLRNPEAVKQALVAFQLARARFTDVPKDVAKKMEALGLKPERPTIERFRKQIPDGCTNTRVVTGPR